MKKYRYEISVKATADRDGQAISTGEPLVFNAATHDELFDIVARARSMKLFDDETAVSFAVGLKLFSEVMLTNRDSELFKDLAPHFGAFMKKLKSQARS